MKPNKKGECKASESVLKMMKTENGSYLVSDLCNSYTADYCKLNHMAPITYNSLTPSKTYHLRRGTPEATFGEGQSGGC